MNLEEILLAKLFAEQVVSEALVDVNTLRFEEVSHIPAPEDAEANVIYLYKNGFSGFYDMYVLINGQVRRLDDTTVDLSSYAKKTELPTKISQLSNDEGYTGIQIIMPTQYMSLDSYEKIILGEDVEESLTSFFDAINEAKNNGKEPKLLVFDSDQSSIISFNNQSFKGLDSGRINQVGWSIFTNAIDNSSSRIFYEYCYNLHEDGRVNLIKIQDSKDIFIIHATPAESGPVFDASLDEIVQAFQQGKALFLHAGAEGFYPFIGIDGEGENEKLVFGRTVIYSGKPALHVIKINSDFTIEEEEIPLKTTSDIPTGGKTGQHLIKTSDEDYDTEWADIPAFYKLISYTDLGLTSEGKTTLAFLDEIAALNGELGSIYRGLLKTTDIPNPSLKQAEVEITVTKAEDDDIVLFVRLSSTDTAPYEWHLIYQNNGTGAITMPWYAIYDERVAAAVPDAAGETPTAAEFNALLASLRAAGILAE